MEEKEKNDTEQQELENLENGVDLVVTNNEEIRQLAEKKQTGLEELTTDEIVRIADDIDGKIDAYHKVRKAIMRLALPGDWVIFGSGEDKEAIGEIGHGGAMRIASVIGIGFANWEATKIEGKDELGEWYRWEFECDSIWRNRTIRAMGRAGSRDKFFGKKYGGIKPLSEISEGDIKMAARRAAMKEGVKLHLGLHRIPGSTLKELGVVIEDAKGYTFGAKTVSEKQVKYLYALMKDCKVADADVKKHIKEQYKKEHKTELNTKEFNEVLSWLKAKRANGGGGANND